VAIVKKDGIPPQVLLDTKSLLVTFADSDLVPSEYLNFFFCPAIISCVQFEFMVTYSIFATRETIFLDLFTFTQQQLQPLQQQTFK
jgi:hypothetical protein